MDALELLRADHRKLEDLFRQFERSEDKTEKKAIADTALIELQVHTTLEEELFYPWVRKKGGIKNAVEEAYEEHHAVEMLMNELEAMDPGDEGYDAKFNVLIQTVQVHIGEEESQLLPKAAEAEPLELQRMGQQLQERRQSLLQEMQARPRAERRVLRSRSGARVTTVRGKTSTRSRTSTAKTSTARSRSATRAGTRSRSTSSTRVRAR